MADTNKSNRQLIEYRLDETNAKIDDAKITIQKQLDGITGKLDNTYATKDYVDNKVQRVSDDVALLKKIVYAAVGIILTAVLVAVVGGVLER